MIGLTLRFQYCQRGAEVPLGRGPVRCVDEGDSQLAMRHGRVEVVPTVDLLGFREPPLQETSCLAGVSRVDGHIAERYERAGMRPGRVGRALYERQGALRCLQGLGLSFQLHEDGSLVAQDAAQNLRVRGRHEIGGAREAAYGILVPAEDELEVSARGQDLCGVVPVRAGRLDGGVREHAERAIETLPVEERERFGGQIPGGAFALVGCEEFQTAAVPRGESGQAAAVREAVRPAPASFEQGPHRSDRKSLELRDRLDLRIGDLRRLRGYLAFSSPAAPAAGTFAASAQRANEAQATTIRTESSIKAGAFISTTSPNVERPGSRAV